MTEFVNAVKSLNGKTSGTEARLLFDAVDRDDDNRVSLSEFINLIKKYNFHIGSKWV